MTAAAHSGGISEESTEAVIAGQDVIEEGRMVGVRWQGNGPDPFADSQLQASDVEAAAAGGGATVEERVKPIDHPGLEVWMNGPFQAPVPMGPVVSEAQGLELAHQYGQYPPLSRSMNFESQPR